jgi:hypothetical protein
LDPEQYNQYLETRAQRSSVHEMLEAIEHSLQSGRHLEGWPLVSRNEVPTIDAEAGELLYPLANGQCFRIRVSEVDDLGSDDPP